MIDPRVSEILDRLYLDDAKQRAANLPPSQRTRNLERETGNWLRLLVMATGARRILEIGSSNGVSTLWLALAARETGGTVTGTEILHDRAAAANGHLAAAGLDPWAQVLPGSAAASISELSGPFDLVFIDAEKDDYIDHFEAVVDNVRPGGLILADNVISHDLSAYQAMLRERADVETVTVPIGRGVEFTIKTAET
ncbi:MAG: class I SAM-dependent methyltransferase [Thermomicrobiales bacterium]